MSRKEALQYWIKTSKRHAKHARDFFESRHYDWCLFLWHLALEKILKALIISRGGQIRYIHKLAILAKDAGLELNPEQIDDLKEITSFNLEA